MGHGIVSRGTLKTAALLLAALVVVVGVSGLLVREARRRANTMRPAPEPTVAVSDLQVGASPPMPAQRVRDDVPEVSVPEVARNLEIVWALRASEDGRLFITERPGRIRVLEPGGQRPRRYARVTTALGGESGLMGLALHPQFPRVPWLYVMYTARKAGGGVNRVSRLVDRDGRGVDEQVLIDDIPAARNHDGGALEFGPDGMLYVGTGDAGRPALAQDMTQQPRSQGAGGLSGVGLHLSRDAEGRILRRIIALRHEKGRARAGLRSLLACEEDPQKGD